MKLSPNKFSKEIHTSSQVYSGVKSDTLVDIKFTKCDQPEVKLKLQSSGSNFEITGSPLSAYLETKANLLGLSEAISEALMDIETLICEEKRNNAINIEAGVVAELSNFRQGWFAEVLSQQDEIFSVSEIANKIKSGELAKSDMVVLISNQADDWANKKISDAKEAYRQASARETVSGQVNGEKITLEKKLGEIPERRKITEGSVLPPEPPTPPESRVIRQSTPPSAWGQNFIKWLKGDDL